MKIGNLKQLNDFVYAVDQCTGGVWLESTEGDRFNLKSKLSQYVAFGELLSESGDMLELFCQNKEDERHFFKFFNDHPEVQK